MDPGRDWFIRQVAVGPAGSDVWVVGSDGLILRINPATGKWRYVDGGFNLDIQDLWVAPDGQVWAVGYATYEDPYEGGSGRILHYDGAEWSLDSIPSVAEVWSVTGSPQGRVWITAERLAPGGGPIDGGPLYTRDGSDHAWSRLFLPSGGEARFPWAWPDGQLWVGSLEGVIWNWDGALWSELPPLGEKFAAIMWGDSKKDAWALASDPWKVVHWDGTAWTPANVAPDGGTASMSGTSSTDVWACGSWGVAHFDGTTWSREKSSGIEDPSGYSIAAHSPTEAWIVADEGRRMYQWDGATWQRREFTGLDEPVKVQRPGPIHKVVTGPSSFWVAGQNGAVLRRAFHDQH
jgi:hypothetical protein